jgi:hypothetical protein
MNKEIQMKIRTFILMLLGTLCLLTGAMVYAAAGAAESPLLKQVDSPSDISTDTLGRKCPPFC